jgi:hypothetical protein
MVAEGELLTHSSKVSEILLRNVPEALRKAIRKLAIDEGTTMNALIIELMKKAIASKK